MTATSSSSMVMHVQQRNLDRLTHASLRLKESASIARVGLTKTALETQQPRGQRSENENAEEWRQGLNAVIDVSRLDHERAEAEGLHAAQEFRHQLPVRRLQEAYTLHRFFASGDPSSPPPPEIVCRDQKVTELLKMDEELSRLLAEIVEVEKECSSLTEHIRETRARMAHKPSVETASQRENWCQQTLYGLVLESGVNWAQDPELRRRMLV